MKENDVIEIIRDFISKKFPKKCCCGKTFNTFAEFLRNTTHSGKPLSNDAEDGDWQPPRPIGTFSFSNCSCGTTMIIGTKGMDLKTLWALMNWAKKEVKSRGVNLNDLLENLRDKIDKRVLYDDAKRA